MINPLGLILTVGLFKGAQRCKNIPFIGKIPPVAIAGILILVILKCFNISFETYNESASYITLMLVPATIALGYPIFKHVNLLMHNKRIIYSGFAVASLVAMSTTYITAKLCHTDFGVIISMLPKSVTAPIAVEISKSMGGVPELTACIVVLTGVFGAVLGHKILSLIHVKSDVAIGLSIGAASHVIGTSRCVEKGREYQVVMASVALVLVGVITSILAPIFIRIVN